MRRALSTLVVFGLLAAACSSGGVSTTGGAGLSSTAFDAETSASPSALELSSTHEITGFGFTIDYPSGWFAETRDSVTGIAELENDLEQALMSEGPQSYAGVTILLDHRPLSFMESIGLPSENPTSEDLLNLNISFFGWTGIVDQPQVTLFGVSAMVVHATARSGQPVVAVQAVRADEGDIFFLSMQAPSMAVLEEVLPTWEAILASSRTAAEASSEGGLTGTFDMGGFGLFITCAGEGSPTVVLEAPLGTGSGIWGEVLPAVAEFTRVCAYDRAGTGSSDSAPGGIARSGNQMVEELKSLLAEAGIAGPYAVVGHSFGGLLVRLFANENPDVTGVVLVESSHPDQIDRFADLLGQTGPSEPDSFNPEGIDVPAVAAEAGTVASLGSIPVVVLTRGLPQPAGPGASAEVTTQAEGLWQALQSDLLVLSTQSAQLIAENSGHNVPVEEPDRVVEAIEVLIEHLQSPNTPLQTP